MKSLREGQAMRNRIVGLLGGGLAAILCTDVAIAQSVEGRAYAGVLVGPYHTNADHVKGSLPSAGVTGGIHILPWLDAEIDVLQSTGVVRREYTGTSISFSGSPTVPPPSDFVVTRTINEREGGNTISVGAVFHPRLPWHRLSPRFFAGVFRHHTEERTVREHVSLPPGVTLDQVNRAMPQEGWTTRQIAGPSYGVSLAIAVTRHLSVVPDFRY